MNTLLTFKKTAGLALGLMLAMLGGCASHQVGEKDDSVHAVVARWAEDAGKTLRWEVDDWGLPEDAQALNQALRRSRNLTEALNVLVTQAQSYRLRNPSADPARGAPLTACIYTNTVHVYYHRSLARPCSGPSAAAAPTERATEEAPE